jgi:hypothetical protein
MPPVEQPFEPRAFFDVVLPGVLLERRVARVGDVIQWYLMGDAEDLAFVCDLSADPAQVYEGEADDPALRIAIDEACVLPLIAGDLDVAKALADEDLQVQGELDVLRRLSELLADGITGMGLLYASVSR